jgi:3-oxoacyl-[acyl-carrier-protein] synthase-3
LSPEAVYRRTGIRTRHWVDEGQATSDLAVEAAKGAFESSGISPESVDTIIVSTTSPDMALPSTACHLQRSLAARHAAAFDVAASCSGFLYGLSMADCLIRSGQSRRCLVVAAEVKSRFLDLQDATTAVLFGDGAGAALLTGEETGGSATTGIMAVRLYADGARYGLLTMPAGGSRQPATADTVRRRLHTIQMQGGPLFRVAVKRLAGAVQDLLKEFGVGIGDLNRVLFHQANGRLLRAVAKRLHMPDEKQYSVLEHLGNTSSASLPIAMDHAVRGGAVHAGDLVLLGTFGGGLTWATALLRW